MTIETAQAIWLGVGAYLGAGAIFSIYFVSRAVDRIDSAAKGSSIWFRLLLAPGAAALWPVLFLKLAAPRRRKGR